MSTGRYSLLRRHDRGAVLSTLGAVGTEGGAVGVMVAGLIDQLEAAIDGGAGASAHAELGGLLYFTDDFAAPRRHWEEAFRGFRDTGDRRAAVRVASDLAELHMSAFGNVSAATGWVARGRRLVDSIG